MKDWQAQGIQPLNRMYCSIRTDAQQAVVIGVIFVAVAFLPKFTALLIAIPAPVAAAYLTVLIGMLFVQGMKIIIQDGVDHRKAVVVGLAFWIGTGFQNGLDLPGPAGRWIPGRAAR